MVVQTLKTIIVNRSGGSCAQLRTWTAQNSKYTSERGERSNQGKLKKKKTKHQILCNSCEPQSCESHKVKATIKRTWAAPKSRLDTVQLPLQQLLYADSNEGRSRWLMMAAKLALMIMTMMGSALMVSRIMMTPRSWLVLVTSQLWRQLDVGNQLVSHA